MRKFIIIPNPEIPGTQAYMIVWGMLVVVQFVQAIDSEDSTVLLPKPASLDEWPSLQESLDPNGGSFK